MIEDNTQRTVLSPEHTAEHGIVLRLLRSAAFRFTIVYLGLFMLAVSVLGIFVYDATFRRSLDQLDQELVEELAYFEKVYQTQGQFALRNLIRGRVNYRDSSIYVMLNVPTGNWVAGNIRVIPPEGLSSEGMFEFIYERPKYSDINQVVSHTAAGRVARFRRGNSNFGTVIMVARDINDLRELRTSARNTIIKVAFGTLILGALLGLLTSRSMLSRIDAINRTASAIREGDLSRRITLTGAGDEFDDLSFNLNTMLDQIERLMLGMRQVSDNIAHDLRSPLTRIRNQIDAALVAPPEEQRPALEATADEVERLLATFNALLSMTRIESGEGAGVLKKVNLADIVEQVTELYEPAAQDAGFELRAIIENVPAISGSRELISQALANLLDNAFKYAKNASGQAPQLIEVTLKPRVSGGAILSVADNGAGVAPSDRARILNRFVRLEESRTTQGSGLGLSMVVAIARAHHARLSLEDGLVQTGPETTEPTYGLCVSLAFPPMPKPEQGSLKKGA